MNPWRPYRPTLGMPTICPTKNPLWGVIPAGAVMYGTSFLPGVTPEAALLMGLITTAGVWAVTQCAEPALAGAASVIFSYFITRQAFAASPCLETPQPTIST